MQPDPFLERVAKVRERFAATLEGKIADTFAALPQMVAQGDAAVAKLREAYQQIHQVSGIAPMVGFTQTGKAARAAEDILIGPFKSGRMLTSEEAARLQAALRALQTAAQSELQITPRQG